MLNFLVCIALSAPLPVSFIQSSDGDTLKVLQNGQKITVRLIRIDTPELKQPYGTDSKAKLNSLLYKKQLTLSAKGTDKYRRTLGIIYANGKDVNAELVKSGSAWCYLSKEYSSLQAEAQKAKRGLWKDKSPTPPWVWRKQKKDAK